MNKWINRDIVEWSVLLGVLVGIVKSTNLGIAIVILGVVYSVVIHRGDQ